TYSVQALRGSWGLRPQVAFFWVLFLGESKKSIAAGRHAEFKISFNKKMTTNTYNKEKQKAPRCKPKQFPS
ncbi:MAG: hypothetical protein FWC72_05310, partial [Oscillospiraceae bacterium]|nr:hypothetical protein [Oscillospiraceae bacterium]